jgi:hypothetical protein
MNAQTFTTETARALEGDAIEHAGIEPPTLEELIAAARAGDTAFCSADERGDPEAYEAAEALRLQMLNALYDYVPTTPDEARERQQALHGFGRVEDAAQLFIADMSDPRFAQYGDLLAGPLAAPPALTDAGVNLNPDLAATIEAAASIMQVWEIEGRKHSAAEIVQEDDEEAWRRADDGWHAFMDKYDEACAAILEAPAAGPAEVYARAGAYLRARAFVALRPQRWDEARTTEGAVEALMSSMPSCEEDLGPALLSILEAFTPPAPTPQSPEPCPVAALIPELERHMLAEIAAADRDDKEASTTHSDKRDEFGAKIAGLQARSSLGAVYQIGLAMEMAELVRGVEHQEDRDFYHTRVEDLLKSALRVIGGELSDDFWWIYVGGDRHPDLILDQEAGKAAWIAARDRNAWETARANYLAARAVQDALPDPATGEEEEANKPIYDAVYDTMEAWEATPPPTIQALAEIMQVSLDFNGLQWVWETADQPNAMRALLDSGDTHQIYAARFYMHVLRLAGIDSRALQTPPMACIYPSYNADMENNTEAAWRQFYAEVQPYPGRGAANVERWNALEASEV